MIVGAFPLECIYGLAWVVGQGGGSLGLCSALYCFCSRVAWQHHPTELRPTATTVHHVGFEWGVFYHQLGSASSKKSALQYRFFLELRYSTVDAVQWLVQACRPHGFPVCLRVVGCVLVGDACGFWVCIVVLAVYPTCLFVADTSTFTLVFCGSSSLQCCVRLCAG